MTSHLSKKSVLRGMALSIANARSLLYEAKSLARIGATARAFALSALSLEEAGKVVLLTLLFHRDRLHLSKRKLNALWSLFRNHKIKTSLVLHPAWKSVLYVRRRKRPPRIAALARYKHLIQAYRAVFGWLEQEKQAEIDGMKLQCLYVDYRSRQFLRPPHPSSAVVKGLMMIAHSAIQDVCRLRDTFRRSNTDELAETIIVVMFRSEMLRETLETLRSHQETAEPNVNGVQDVEV